MRLRSLLLPLLLVALALPVRAAAPVFYNAGEHGIVPEGTTVGAVKLQ